MHKGTRPCLSRLCPLRDPGCLPIRILMKMLVANKSWTPFSQESYSRAGEPSTSSTAASLCTSSSPKPMLSRSAAASLRLPQEAMGCSSLRLPALTRRNAATLLDEVERSVHHIRRDEVADAALLLREDRRRAIVFVHQVDHGHVVVQGLVRLQIISQDELARAAQDSESQRGDQPYLDSIAQSQLRPCLA